MFFPYINIRWVPSEVLKTKGEARGTQRMLMGIAHKNMFDGYYCINCIEKDDFRAVFRCVIFALFCLDFFYIVERRRYPSGPSGINTSRRKQLLNHGGKLE